jgi:uncharacterized protein with HEPN domain
MKRDDRVYLRHILEAIEQIQEYTKGMDDAQFLNSRLVQDGVVRQLEIVGEATKNLSQPTLEKAPELPWKDMAGMRDVLIHQYFGVDLAAVWETVVQDVPWVKSEIEKLLKLLDE